MRTDNKMTIRQKAAAAILTITLGISALLPHTALAISLKETGVIEGDTIRLGDLFTGLERDADKVLGAAPRPGQDMILDARTLTRVATALDLPWRPATSADQIVLRRAATIVDASMIKDALKNEITAHGMPGKFDIVLPAGEQQIILPRNAERSLEIVSLNVIPGKDNFEALIVAPSKNNPLKEMKVNGTLRRMIDVPVLQGALQNGDVIGQQDIGFIESPAETIAQGTVLKAEDLLGMTPRRLLHAGQPIKGSDIVQPRMVERGKSVTMTFSQAGLILTAQGKALENGSKGDVIRVVNAASSKTIEATVTGAGEVSVQSF